MMKINNSGINENSCLFCGEYKQCTSEHIIQSGFGSNWTLPKDVCSECNTREFSSLDKQLIDFAHYWIYPSHPDVPSRRTFLQSGHNFSYDESSGIWYSVRLGNNLHPTVFPQIILIDDTHLRLVLDPVNRLTWETQLDQMQRELSEPKKLDLKESITPVMEDSLPAIQPALIRSAPNTYFLCASNYEDVTKLKQLVLSGQLLFNLVNDSTPNRTTRQDGIHGRVSVPLLNIERAIAKSAVNVVCACLGPDRAREPALDPIKSFVRGQIPYGEHTFVGHGWAKSESAGNLEGLLGRTDKHTVLLTNAITQLPTVVILLYQKLFAIVNLTEEESFMTERDATLVFINYKNKSHEIYSLEENPITFFSKFSGQ